MYFVMISGEQIPLLQSRKTSLKIQDLVFQLLYLTISSFIRHSLFLIILLIRLSKPQLKNRTTPENPVHVTARDMCSV